MAFVQKVILRIKKYLDLHSTLNGILCFGTWDGHRKFSLPLLGFSQLHLNPLHFLYWNLILLFPKTRKESNNQQLERETRYYNGFSTCSSLQLVLRKDVFISQFKYISISFFNSNCVKQATGTKFLKTTFEDIFLFYFENWLQLQR